MTTTQSSSERAAALRARADAAGGLIDCTVGSPCDPVPGIVTAALARAGTDSAAYPFSIGAAAYREAASAWMARRFGVQIAPDAVAACVGTKEFVASLPLLLARVDPSRAGRDTVLRPELAYPTYAFGADLAGCRTVTVPIAADGMLDLAAVRPDDAARARLLWLNLPSNPTGAVTTTARLSDAVAWARQHGIVMVDDECYVDLAPEAGTILAADPDHAGVLALHSVSKRSNLAGLRAGFYAGDPALVTALGAARRDLGMIVPTAVQAAAIAALGDDAHVAEQRARYEARAARVVAALAPLGVEHDGGPMPFYLWLRDTGGGDGWTLAEWFAEVGVLVNPGSVFGAAGRDHVRLALVQPDDRIAELAARLGAARPPSDPRRGATTR